MKLFNFSIVILALALSACVPFTTISSRPTDSLIPESLAEANPVPTEGVLYEMKIYTDSMYGFSFDYPASWMLDVIKLGDRAPQSIQLTSWTHKPGTVSEIQKDGTIMNVTVQLWDPKGDLAAFVATRIEAWKNSGNTVISQEELLLAGGVKAQEIILQSSSSQEYFLITLLGEDYLVFSGSGDLDVIGEVARSIR